MIVGASASRDQIAPMARMILEPMFTLPFGEVKLSTLVLGPDELTGGVEGASGGPAGGGVFGGGGAGSSRRGAGPGRVGATSGGRRGVRP
jgi:hypothetical protein